MTRVKDSQRAMEGLRAPAILLLREAARLLRQAGIEGPEKEAETIIKEGIGLSVLALYRDNPSLTEDEGTALREIVRRRAKREPLQYILGHVEFSELTLKVGPGVLIPRPETETLVEEALKKLKGLQSETKRPVAALDLCTGCGAVALAIGATAPGVTVYGVDISDEALRFAEENKKSLSWGLVAPRRGPCPLENVVFLKGNLFEPVREMKFDIIVSNPPYIKKSVIDTLQPEVRDWEPREALDGGADGLDFIRAILKDAPAHLKPGGYVILEIADGQKDEVMKIAGASGLKTEGVARDYAGVERVVVFEQGD